MKHDIVRVFDSFSAAQQAREALLAAGFAQAAVQLSVSDDEAGPVEGNFTVGNSAQQRDDHTYARNYARPAQRGHCMIVVAEADPALAARAAGILEGFGAR